MPSKLLSCIGFLYKVVHKIGFSLCSFSHFSFLFNFQTAEALVLKFGPLPLYHFFSNTVLAIFDIFFRFRLIFRPAFCGHPYVQVSPSIKKSFLLRLCGQNFDLHKRDGAGGPTIAQSLSCTRLFAMPVSTHSLAGREGEREREREGNLKKLKQQRRSGQPLFFSLHCEPALEVRLRGFINGVDDTYRNLW